MKASIKINIKSIQFQDCVQEGVPNYFSIQEIIVRPNVWGIKIEPGIECIDHYSQKKLVEYLTPASIIFEHKQDEEVYNKLMLICDII